MRFPSSSLISWMFLLIGDEFVRYDVLLLKSVVFARYLESAGLGFEDLGTLCVTICNQEFFNTHVHRF